MCEKVAVGPEKWISGDLEGAKLLLLLSLPTAKVVCQQNLDIMKVMVTTRPPPLLPRRMQ